MSQDVPEHFKGFGFDPKSEWGQLKAVEYSHPEINSTDVVTKNICCGLCGSDVHNLKGSWGSQPQAKQVVGHEIVGHVIAVGSAVSEFKVGDRVGIGAASNSCGDCGRCRNNDEQYCKRGIWTYARADEFHKGTVTQGGYSSHSITDERFVFAIPNEIPSEEAAPLFCAGLTVFSPLVRNLGEDASGKTVGIIGIGGLGHLAIQFAAAMGAKVYAFSRSSAKAEEAKQMGATDLIATGQNDDWNNQFDGEFDLIINCASSLADLDTTKYLSILRVGGTLLTVGVGHASESIEIKPFNLLMGGTKVAGSGLGSKKEANLMLKIAADKNVRPWIEKIQISEEGCNTALTRCDKGDIRYRFVFTGYESVFGTN